MIKKYQKSFFRPYGINWKELSRNPNLPWQEENLLDQFKDKWKWDRVPFNPLFKDCSSVMDYTQKDWKKKYYDILLDAPDIGEICKNYFDGLVFVVRYYFDGEVCWNWYNPYHYCPFASDLNSHL